MSLSKVKDIIAELESLGFIDVTKPRNNFNPKLSYTDDSDHSDPSSNHLLFFQFLPWLFRFCYKEDSFWIWDDNVNDWVKTDITDISTLLVLYK